MDLSSIFHRCNCCSLYILAFIQQALLISKLVWRRESQSDKQWRDILGILKVQREKLDFVYLREWVERFGLVDDWQRAKVEAGVSHLDADDI